MQDLVFSSDAITVTEALKFADSLLCEITLVVRGEVTDVKDRSYYKAVYFSIKDDSSVLKCHIWKNRLTSAGGEIREGALVNLTGKFSIYAKKGDMSFDVTSIEAAGEGELRRKVNELIEKLKAGGHLDAKNKKELPAYPEKIGLVTSGAGAVVHDVLRTIRRRCASIEVYFWGVNVEGKTAATQMISAIEALDAEGLDAILLVRGGGSFEDMMPFNDEALCGAILSARTPIVTGIGHEPDTTVADLVADFRASTPTAAAEIITKNLVDLQQSIYAAADMLSDTMSAIIDSSKQSLERQKFRLDAISPVGVYEKQKMRISFAREKMLSIANEFVKGRGLELAASAKRLEALSPLAVLSRGYACAYNESNKIIKSVDDCNVGEKLNLKVVDGVLKCEVKDIVRV